MKPITYSIFTGGIASRRACSPPPTARPFVIADAATPALALAMLARKIRDC